MKFRVEVLLVLIVGVSCIACVAASDANGEHAGEDSPKISNKDDDNSQETFRNLVRPFRMEKLNLIWVKAQQVNNRIDD